MGRMLSTLLRESRPGVLVFHCPGCNSKHFVYVDKVCGYPEIWQYNGNPEKPTFSPSLNVNRDSDKHRCHSNIINGMISFCDDSWHDLKGKTVPMVRYYPTDLELQYATPASSSEKTNE